LDTGFSNEPDDLLIGRSVVDLGNRRAASRLPFEELPDIFEAAAQVQEAVLAEERIDYNVDVGNKLSMNVEGDLLFLENALDDGKDVAFASFTDWSFRQFANRVCPQRSRPATYLATCWPELRADNINLWLPKFWESGKRSRSLKLRARMVGSDEQIFAVVSTRYHALDIDEIASILMDEAPEGARADVVVTGGRRMLFSVVLDQKVVDVFRPSIIVTTSDDGTMSIRVKSAMRSKYSAGSIILNDEEAVNVTARHSRLGASAPVFTETVKGAFHALEDVIESFKMSWEQAEEQVVFGSLKKMENYFKRLVEKGHIWVPGYQVKRGSLIELLVNTYLEHYAPEEGTKDKVIHTVLRVAAENHRMWDVWGEEALHHQAGRLLLANVRSR